MKANEITTPTPACMFCSHYWRGVDTARRCFAFREIPESIWSGQDFHRDRVPGDKGITFDPIPEVELPDYLEG